MQENTKDLKAKKSNIKSKKVVKKDDAKPVKKAATSKKEVVKKSSTSSKKSTNSAEKKTTKSKAKKDVVKETAKPKATTKKLVKEAAKPKATTKTVVKEATKPKATTKKVVKEAAKPKAATKKVLKEAAKPKTATVKTKKAETTEKKEAKKKVSSSKATEKKASTKKKSSTTRKNTKRTKINVVPKTSRKATARKPKAQAIEYYDLPYRYNQTVVKILAQTPKTLFVYWDISDNDRQRYVQEFGENFFNDTYPVLIVHNKTMNYSFEIEINDFANSWYFTVNDPKCNYEIELGRRPRNGYVHIPNNYMHVTSSNTIEAPNSHILFEKNQKVLFFRNVKNGHQYSKDVSQFSFMQYFGRIYNIYDIYKKIYKTDELRDIEKNPTSTFNKGVF